MRSASDALSVTSPTRMTFSVLRTGKNSRYLQNPQRVLIKDEGRLPTGSFKARGLALAVSMAKELGIQHLAMPTNGNAGAAMAAYASLGGMRATVFCPSDTPDVNVREIELQGFDVIALNVTKLRSDNIDPREYLGRLEEWQGRVEKTGGHWRVINDLDGLEGLL